MNTLFKSLLLTAGIAAIAGCNQEAAQETTQQEAPAPAAEAVATEEARCRSCSC